MMPFAAKVSDGQYETLEDLSKVLSDNILEAKKRRINVELRETMLNALVEQSHVIVHPVLIDDEVEEILHQSAHMFSQLSPEQYLRIIGKSREEFAKDVRPDAEMRVKHKLVLDEIAQREQISVQTAEIEALSKAYAQMGQKLPDTPEQLRALMVSYRREKAFNHLLELTTDPDPDMESEAEAATSITNAEAAAVAGEIASATQETESEAEAAMSITSAEAAAVAGEIASATQAESEAETLEESVTATPLPQESRTETVE